MNTKLYMCVLAVFSLSIYSCYEDIGNYSYSEPEIITVEGIEPSYDRVAGVDKLTITPTVSSSIPDATFTYRWAMYETEGTGIQLETIATTKDLNYEINKEAKIWRLVFYVTNTKTNYTHIVKSSIQVSTNYTRGWYVLKDDGKDSDLDLFITQNSIIPTVTIDDIFSKMHSRKLSGKALKLSFSAEYRAPGNNGVFTKVRTLFAVAESDLFAVKIDNMKIIRDRRTITYQTIKDVKFQTFGSSSSNLFLLFNGYVHGIAGMVNNVGIFGMPKLIDDVASEYRMSKFFVPCVSNTFGYDDLSCTLFKVDANQTILQPLGDSEETELSVNKNNKECLFLGVKKETDFKGTDMLGVFKDKTTNERIILSINTSNLAKCKTKIVDKLTEKDKANSASIYTLSNDENMMYFVAEGKIWSRNLSNKNEKIEFTLPAGEEVSLIRHLKCTNKNDADYLYNFVVVGSNKDGKYKIRMFEKIAGNFVSETPRVEFGGEGNCADIIYISPKITNNPVPHF